MAPGPTAASSRRQEVPEDRLQEVGGTDFTVGPVVKKPSANAGDTGSIPGLGTKIPHARGKLSQCTTTAEAYAPQLDSNPCSLQLERNLQAAVKTQPGQK